MPIVKYYTAQGCLAQGIAVVTPLPLEAALVSESNHALNVLMAKCNIIWLHT